MATIDHLFLDLYLGQFPCPNNAVEKTFEKSLVLSDFFLSQVNVEDKYWKNDIKMID